MSRGGIGDTTGTMQFAMKAYGVVRMPEDIIGPDRFMQILLMLLDQFRNRYLSFERFQAAVEFAAQQKLDWYFHDWVETNSVASHAIAAVNPREGGVDVQVRRTGMARFPLEIRVTTEDGTEIVKRISYESEVQTLSFTTPSPPKRISSAGFVTPNTAAMVLRICGMS